VEEVFEKSHDTPDEVMRATHRQIEATLAQGLPDRIHSASPVFSSV
jgi:hypothetical protein